MNPEKVGRIVWHDLFTRDVDASKTFYHGVAGWHFVTEHATDFAWGGGERDFVLALLGDEAGTGFVELPDGGLSGWIPYVEVEDVDAVAEIAEGLDAQIEKAPFDVPGVGQNCLLRDPMGALVGICVSSHGFPTPTKQFEEERYVAPSDDFPEEFYCALFGWHIQPSVVPDTSGLSIMLTGRQVAIQTTADSGQPALWVPGVRVKQLPEALNRVLDLGGAIVDSDRGRLGEKSSALITDLNGSLTYLVSSRESHTDSIRQE